MPEKIFSRKLNTQPELTRQDLESLMRIKDDSDMSEAAFLAKINAGPAGTFIVDNNFNVFLSLNFHHILLKRLGVSTSNCLVSSANFGIDSKRKLKFTYSNPDEKKTVVHEVAEDKIRKLFKSKGLDISA